MTSPRRGIRRSSSASISVRMASGSLQPRCPSSRSPLKKYEAVERPKAQDHFADDVAHWHRTERARVGRERAVVAHDEDLPVRDRERINDLRCLRLRRAVGLSDIHLVAVHEDIPVAPADRLAAAGYDALYVRDRGVGDGRVEHDDVAALRLAKTVVELAHEDPIVLLECRLHRSLTDLGDLDDEQIEDHRYDDREGQRLDDFED